MENTYERFKDFLYNKEFKKFVDFIGYTTSLQMNEKPDTMVKVKENSND